MKEIFCLENQKREQKMAESKNIGIKVKKPGKACTDKKCPFHGEIGLRGKMFTGVVLARDTHGSATVEWTYTIFIPKQTIRPPLYGPVAVCLS